MKFDKRILCIWLPCWPLERLALARAELRGRPVLLYEVQARGGGLKVSAYTSALAAPPESPPQLPAESPIAGAAEPGRHSPAPRTRTGIQAGMPLAEALALHEFSLLRQPHADQALSLHVEAHDPWADRLALGQLAIACQQFSPSVGLEDAPQPACLLLDITGSAAVLGGEAALVASAAGLLAGQGLTARLAVADTVGAAWAVAHGPGAAQRPVVVPPGETLPHVACLPIALLRLPCETLALLAELGIRRIEQLGRLPRSSLLCRFGPQLVQRLDQACGMAQEVIDAQHTAGEIEAQWPLEYATNRRDAIETILQQLLPRLIEPLDRQRKGVLKLVCRLDCQDGQPWHLPLGLFRASASAEHLFDMLRLRLESVWLRSPVTAVRLTVVLSGLLDTQQQELFTTHDQRGAVRDLASLVDRLTSRLGRQAVLRPKLLADAQPEHACQYLPLWDAVRTNRQPRRGSAGRAKIKSPSQRQPPAEVAAHAPGERPLRLHAPPVELAVLAIAPDGPPLRFRWSAAEQQVGQFWGPERIETGWWRSRCVRRDYYRVETTTGQQFWLFRRLADGRWFLHGTFE